MKIPAELQPYWRIPGTVAETRELRTKTDNSVWLYIVKIMGMGGVFELQTKDPEIYKQAGLGETVTAEGYFEASGKGVSLVLRNLTSAARS